MSRIKSLVLFAAIISPVILVSLSEVAAKKPPKTTVIEVCKPPATCDYETITAAIGAANSGDEIVVHPDTYFENIDYSGKAITIRSTDPGDPAVVAATVIDGGAAGRVVTMSSNEGPAILDGLTIRNGSAYAGGGISVGGSEPTVRNCTIAGNTAETGGGIYTSSSAPVISNCTITGNTATDTYGGGIAVGTGPGSGAAALITGCTITGNSALNEAQDEFTGQWFPVGAGGGISVMYHDGLTIEKSLISGNSASKEGGGIFSIYADIHISQSIISDNTVSYGDGLPRGGGVSIVSAGPDYGGAGAVPATVDNCLVTGNSATGMQYDEITQQYYLSGMGGGIALSAANLLVRNSTITGNFADYDGSAIHGSSSNTTADITNSIVYLNAPGTQLHSIFPANFYNITYSDVEGGHPGVGNIDADPLFAGVGNYRLSDVSPCTDAGTDLTAEGITVDIEDIPRPQGPAFDMGAYETLELVAEERKLCDDGIDNDGDGLTDCDDPGCARYRTCR